MRTVGRSFDATAIANYMCKLAVDGLCSLAKQSNFSLVAGRLRRNRLLQSAIRLGCCHDFCSGGCSAMSLNQLAQRHALASQSLKLLP